MRMLSLTRMFISGPLLSTRALASRMRFRWRPPSSGGSSTFKPEPKRSPLNEAPPICIASGKEKLFGEGQHGGPSGCEPGHDGQCPRKPEVCGFGESDRIGSLRTQELATHALIEPADSVRQMTRRNPRLEVL